MLFLSGLTLMFWVGLFGFLVILALMESSKGYYLTTVPFTITVGLLYCYFAGYNPFPDIAHNFHWIMLGAIGYLVVGSFWSWFMLGEKVEKDGERMTDNINLLSERIDLRPRPNMTVEEIIEYAQKQYTPTVRQYYSRLVGWIANWPVSMAVWVLNDFLDKLFKKIIEHMTVLYNRVITKVMGRAVANLDVENLKRKAEEAARQATQNRNRLSGHPADSRFT